MAKKSGPVEAIKVRVRDFHYNPVEAVKIPGPFSDLRLLDRVMKSLRAGFAANITVAIEAGPSARKSEFELIPERLLEQWKLALLLCGVSGIVFCFGYDRKRKVYPLGIIPKRVLKKTPKGGRR